jgi:hypothetical protein
MEWRQLQGRPAGRAAEVAQPSQPSPGHYTTILKIFKGENHWKLPYTLLIQVRSPLRWNGLPVSKTVHKNLFTASLRDAYRYYKYGIFLCSTVNVSIILINF